MVTVNISVATARQLIHYVCYGALPELKISVDSDTLEIINNHNGSVATTLAVLAGQPHYNVIAHMDRPHVAGSEYVVALHIDGSEQSLENFAVHLNTFPDSGIRALSKAITAI